MDELTAREILLKGVGLSKSGLADSPAGLLPPKCNFRRRRDQAFPAALPTVWNVSRHPFNSVLYQVVKTSSDNVYTQCSPQNGRLHWHNHPPLAAFGGISVTGQAIEYAYRNRSYYQTVLWARADSYDALASDFVSFAEMGY